MSVELDYLLERPSAVLMSATVTDLQLLAEQSSSICDIEMQKPAASLTIAWLGLGLFLFESLLVCTTSGCLLYWVAAERIASNVMGIGNTPASLVSFELSHNQGKESSR